MLEAFSDYIQVYNNRVYIDVASKGCGSGCVYCFSHYPCEKQELLDISTISNICDNIEQMPNCEDLIISLCPNTEPMKSEESRSLVFHIINRLSSKVKFIQISTKESIPDLYLEQLNKKAKRAGQIRISISLPFVNNVNQIEPGAASVNNRLINFERIRKYSNLTSILYLRPFNKQMLLDKDIYVNIIKKYMPNDICLGAEFVPRVDSNQQCTYMYDASLRKDIFERSDNEELFAFADYLRDKCSCKVFFSSICNIANCSDYGCILSLYKYDNRYCKDCILMRDD